QGAPIDVRDPLAPRLRAISDAAGGRPEAIVDGLLGVREIFAPALAADDTFRTVLTRHLAALTERGAAATVAGLA
ncbi:MAG TPA: mannitol dehydrogenase family protein, partial [Bauldia sp.]|nr:mannitol dehydrogenase family protein [Bauldia sp.]